MATTKKRASQEDQARRGVLAHIEHVRSVGEAFVRAADAYLTEHRISEMESNWQDDFRGNVSQSAQEFHRALSESSTRVLDLYFGRSDDPDEPENFGRRTRRDPGPAASGPGPGAQ